MFWLTTAIASAPVVSVNADNSVTGSLTVGTAPDVVRAKMADPLWVARTDNGGTTVTVKQREGDCVVTDNVSPSAIREVIYTLRQCPSPTGFVSTLVTSNSFDSYRATWTFVPSGEGTTMTYHLELNSSLMVPQFLINSSAKKGVKRLMDRLDEHFD